LVIMAWLAHITGGLTQEALTIINLLAGVGMAIGLFSVFLEIARKARFLYVLRRPHSSWMTRETYAVAVFYPALFAQLLWPTEILNLIVVLAAAAFLYCQGRILHAAQGIPAWRVKQMPWMLILTGLFEGAGLLAIAADLIPGLEDGAIVAAGCGGVLAAINAILWQRYLSKATVNKIPPLAMRVLKEQTLGLRIIGHVLPLLGFAIFLSLTPDQPIIAAIAGFCAVVGGASWKRTVITRACHQQGFALPKVPQRGSGTFAAPIRMGRELNL